MTVRNGSWFAILCALPLAGCVQLDSALNVSPDGSGRLHLVYSMSAKGSDRLQEIPALAAQLDKAAGREGAAAADPDLETPFPFEENAVRKALKAALDRGVAIESLKISKQRDTKSVDLTLAFKRLSDLAGGPLIADTEFTLTQGSDGNYRLTQRVFGQAEPVELMNADVEKNLAPLLRGMKITIAMTVPNRLRDANAARRVDRTLYWEVDFDRDPSTIRRYQRDGAFIVFEPAETTRPASARTPPAP